MIAVADLSDSVGGGGFQCLIRRWKYTELKQIWNGHRTDIAAPNLYFVAHIIFIFLETRTAQRRMRSKRDFKFRTL